MVEQCQLNNLRIGRLPRRVVYADVELGVGGLVPPDPGEVFIR
jgi:hypothetical protein